MAKRKVRITPKKHKFNGIDNLYTDRTNTIQSVGNGDSFINDYSKPYNQVQTTGTKPTGSASGGGNFASTAQQVSGLAGMFDSIAQGITSGIDSGRAGAQNQPREITEGVLGAQTGSHLGSMWTTGAKTKQAIDFVNAQGNTNYNAGTTEELLGRYNDAGQIAHSNIDTSGKELEDFVFDPASYILTSMFGLRETADERQRRINEAIDKANRRRSASLDYANTNLNKRRFNSIMSNYYDFGGPMFGQPVFGATSYDIAKDNAFAKQMQVQSKNSTSFNPIFNSSGYEFGDGGGIHIKESHKGLFTAKANRAGKGVQEYASHVIANAEDYPEDTVKQARFAKAAAGWKHADGGMLMSDQFTNGVTLINQGGSHENNPHEGVQMGIAPDGAPNLVEEGEAVYNDYVFSNRIRVPKEVRNKYKLRGPKKMTFAEAFREAQKESAERENDPISKNGLDHIAMILARTQEAVRGYERAKKGYKAALGGHLYAGVPITEEEVKEPETEEAINAFWKSKLGDNYYDDPYVRLRYMENDEANPGRQLPEYSDSAASIRPLRLAPVAAQAGAVVSDALGWTNNVVPIDEIPTFNPITYTPLGNYLPTYHTDVRYEANRRAQEAAAARNAIMQSSSPNKWGTLLAADYNAQIAEGEALRQAALNDYSMLVNKETFNRATNQANSEMGLKTAMANQEEALKYGRAKMEQARTNIEETNAARGAQAANISGLADSLAGIATEQDARDWRDMLLRAGVYGTLSEKPDGWTEAEWNNYKKGLTKKRACGGKIRRKKKGLTY